MKTLSQSKVDSLINKIADFKDAMNQAQITDSQISEIELTLTWFHQKLDQNK